MTRPLLFVLLVALAAPALAQEAAGPDVAPESPPRRSVSLFADLRALQAGDLLTVLLVERTAARQTLSSSAAESRAVGGDAGTSGGGFFGLDARVAGERDSDRRTVQSDLLEGTITAQVVDVDPAGNLIIEGERRLNVDGATHLMTVRGLVRPADVGPSNTVLSHQIAGADVVYRQEGGSKFLSGRFLTLVGTVAVLAGAVVLGSTLASGAAADAPADVEPETPADPEPTPGGFRLRFRL
jgi:flagellar L-ring protein precursor FlgH